MFGIEVATENGREPTIEAAIPGGSTLNEALTVVAMAAPGYKFVVVSPHLINFIPPGSENDPEDLLNLHLSKFRLDDVSPGNFIGNPARYLPELKAALAGGKPRGCEIGPGLSDKAPGITLSGNAVSLRQLLNLVSEPPSHLRNKIAALATVGSIYMNDFHRRVIPRMLGGCLTSGILRSAGRRRGFPSQPALHRRTDLSEGWPTFAVDAKVGLDAFSSNNLRRAKGQVKIPWIEC